MHKILSSKFADLEKSGEELLELLKAADLKKLNYKPADDKWSVIQIIFHLVKVENVFVLNINKQLKSKDLQKPGISAFLRTGLLRLILKSPAKIKSPRLFAGVPGTYDLQELRNRWSKIRLMLNERLENLPADLHDKNLFDHPYAGKMNIIQGLDFLQNHLSHHLKQIKKRLKEFPE